MDGTSRNWHGRAKFGQIASHRAVLQVLPLISFLLEETKEHWVPAAMRVPRSSLRLGKHPKVCCKKESPAGFPWLHNTDSSLSGLACNCRVFSYVSFSWNPVVLFPLHVFLSPMDAERTPPSRQELVVVYLLPWEPCRWQQIGREWQRRVPAGQCGGSSQTWLGKLR